MPDERPPEEAPDPSIEYPLLITGQQAGLMLNCLTFLINSSRGDVPHTIQSFELALNDMRLLGPDAYNVMAQKLVDVVKRSGAGDIEEGEDNKPTQFTPPLPKHIQ